MQRKIEKSSFDSEILVSICIGCLKLSLLRREVIDSQCVNKQS